MFKVVLTFFDLEGEIIQRIQLELQSKQMLKKIIKDYIVYTLDIENYIAKIEIEEVETQL
jgi:hypothetical protein